VAIQFDAQTGYFEVSYNGPYGGLHVQAPPILLADNYSPATTNFMFRNQAITSRPNFTAALPAPPGGQVLGFGSFSDSNNTLHSYAFTSLGLWQMQVVNNQVWQLIGGPKLFSSNPVAVNRFVSNLYYTNGGPYLSSWDGLAQAPTDSVATVANLQTVLGSTYTASAGDIGGNFLCELDSHLLMANLSVLDEGSNTVYFLPNYIWWSASGLPAVWDPDVNTSAGYNPLVDVPDKITGMITAGNAGYIFRTNGISQFSPTGSGIAPFQFDHLWSSSKGIGNVYPWSIASYGSLACFISTEQIYQMSVNSFGEIGGGARDAIMADLANAYGTPVGQILPVLAYGYVYLCYYICIPLGTFTRHYVYSIEDKNWAVWDVKDVNITGRPEIMWNVLQFGQSLFTYPGGIPTAQSINQQPSGGIQIPGIGRPTLIPWPYVP
jgi:hypothetical protein